MKANKPGTAQEHIRKTINIVQFATQNGTIQEFVELFQELFWPVRVN